MTLTPRAKRIKRAALLAGRPIADEVAATLAAWNGSSAAMRGMKLQIRAAAQIHGVAKHLRRSKDEEDADDLHAADLEDDDEDDDDSDEEEPKRKAASGEVRLDDLAAAHRARKAAPVAQLGRPANEGNPFATLGAAYLRAAGVR